MRTDHRTIRTAAFATVAVTSLLFAGTRQADAAAVVLGAYSFDSSQFGNTLSQSDGGTFAASNWLNLVNSDPGSPAYLTGANFDTGIANIGLGGNVSYTIGYGTPIVNGAGADFGVVTARYSVSDTITLTIGGMTVSYGPGLAVSTGVGEDYFYGGSGPYPATLFVTSIDLSDFGVAAGGSVNAITVTGGPELDLVRIAGFSGTPAVPEPATLALLGAGLAALGGLRSRRRVSAG